MFFKKSGKDRILSIEIHDEKIDNDISRLILAIEKEITLLQESLRKDDYSEKDEIDRSLVKKFLEMMKKTDEIIQDVYRIRAIELQEKGYITLRDTNYLTDKLKQLTVIKENVSSLIDLFKEQPSDADFESGLLDDILESLEKIIISMSKIKEDDKFLKQQYELMAKAA